MSECGILYNYLGTKCDCSNILRGFVIGPVTDIIGARVNSHLANKKLNRYLNELFVSSNSIKITSFGLEVFRSSNARSFEEVLENRELIGELSADEFGVSLRKPLKWNDTESSLWRILVENEDVFRTYQGMCRDFKQSQGSLVNGSFPALDLLADERCAGTSLILSVASLANGGLTLSGYKYVPGLDFNSVQISANR